MKVVMRIVILLSICIPLYAKEEPYNLPTAEQVRKLAEAAWNVPVNSIDVTLYKEIKEPSKSIEEFRQMFENFFDKAEGPKENLSGWGLEERHRTIQMNVERAVKEQEVGRRMKQRIRIDGYRQRIDQVIGYPKMVLLEGTPHERIRPEVLLGPNTPYDMTLVNLGDKHKGDYTSFAYYHKMKGATITDKRGSRWAKSSIIDFARLLFSFQGLLGVNQGAVFEQVFVPDPNKMEKLRQTGLVAGMLRVRINPDPNNPDTRDRIEIKSDDYPCGTVIICNREDYSRVYYMEVCNPGTGELLYIKEFSDFDSQDFPRKATIIEYDLDGKLKKKEVYIVEKVELNPSIQDDVFEFQPPVGYKVTDFRSDK